MPIEALSFADDGDVPNHPHWPMIVYAQAIAPKTLKKAPYAFDELFERNGWPAAWRNDIYTFTHYHSKTHEVLGIAKGEATVQFGGKSGKILTARAGDALLLPAGTGHKRISSSSDLLVIGAYPPGSKYDLMRSGEPDKAAIRARIAKVAKPLPIRLPVLLVRCSACGLRIKLTWQDLNWHNKWARCSETIR